MNRPAPRQTTGAVGKPETKELPLGGDHAPEGTPSQSTLAPLDFLERLHPGGPSTVTVYKPKPEGATLPNREASEWAAERDRNSDIYVLVGLAEGSPVGQPKKEQMRGSGWLWCDLDPRAGEDLEQERERIRLVLTNNLPADVPPPSLMVDSGRGMWALWQLAEPCLDSGRVEACNLWLANQLDADKCHNINRVMRLAGTINLKTGRRSSVLVDDPDRVYSIDQFQETHLAPSSPRGESNGSGKGGHLLRPVRVADLAELDQWDVPKRVKVVIAQGRLPDEPPKEGDDSRSAWLFDACCNLVRAGVRDEVILGIITDPEWAISESVLDKGRRAESYAAKQLAAAHNTVAEDEDQFQTNEKGVPHPNQHNIRLALGKLGVGLSHDQFADQLRVEGLPGHGPVLQDETVAALYLIIDERYRFRPGKDFFWMVVEDTARRAGYHPVHDYLDGLTWDGKPRVDRWLIDYGGAADTPYVRAVGALPLIAAVRRVRDPGCKFDEMLVLRSPQGTGKSTALATLCPRPEWFSDDLPLDADTKVAIERMHGRWIVEAAELKGMRANKIEHMKAFLSRQVDRARMAYGRIPKEVPRQCVFVGTTNSERFLRDTTGDRRYWPLEVGRFDLDALRRDRDQIWAEAAHREAAGESIRLAPSLYEAAAEAQEEHRVEDPFVERLDHVLGSTEGKLLASDAWEIVGVPPGQRTQDHNQRLGEAMRKLGWQRTKLRFDGDVQNCYTRGEGTGENTKSYQRIIVRTDPQGQVTAGPETPF